jgi:superfamily II DNA or RNA helicase
MVQAGFSFTRSEDSGLIVPAKGIVMPPHLAANGKKPHDFQVRAIDGAWEKLEDNRSPMTVIYTGGGKTFCLSLIAREWPRHFKLSKRILVLAHRDEIVRQNRAELEAITGEQVGLEKADAWAGDERIVSASVQTLRGARLERWKSSDFGLVIVDECHHVVSKSWRAITDYFSGAKLLGYTATPRRGDEKALGLVFDSVACIYELADAIADKKRPPFVVKKISIKEIDLSACRKNKEGDFNKEDLDAAMAVEEALHGVVDATLKESGDRRTIVFTTSVENAHRLAEIFNRYRTACAMAVDGETETDERRRIIASHQRGEFQYLVNVGITTEGYNDERISCVSMGRPSSSRLLIEQMIGRARAVGSENALVIEFTGNMGKIRQSSTADVLGGKYEEAEVEAADKIIEANPGIRADEALAQAHAEAIEKEKQAEIARRASLTAKVSYSVHEFNPFDVLHLKTDRNEEWEHRLGGKIASEKQINYLKALRVDIPKDCTSAQASRLIGTVRRREEVGLANYRQVRELTAAGIPALNISYKHACGLVWELRQNKGQRLAPDVIERITGGARQPGEEG